MGATGEFVRDTRYLNGRITADGRNGTLPAEAGRYRLVVARACPWANRTMIVRRLLGLEDALSMGICGPEHDWRSWTFDLDPGAVDPVLGIHWLRDAYEKAVPGYERGVTVPAIVEVAAGAVVTADYRQITLDLEHEWTAFHRPGAPELYPDKLQDEIEEISAGVYEDVNNGVYKCGFASTQAAYEESYAKLFARLDELSLRDVNGSNTRRIDGGNRLAPATRNNLTRGVNNNVDPPQDRPQQHERDQRDNCARGQSQRGGHRLLLQRQGRRRELGFVRGQQQSRVRATLFPVVSQRLTIYGTHATLMRLSELTNPVRVCSRYRCA